MRSIPGSRQRAFTLIELLVAIAIMAVLLSMLLPAVQNARHSARSVQCRSRLSQLGEAFHSYHQSFRALPAGSIDQQSPAISSPERYVWGWALALLPFLGEQNLHHSLNGTLGVLAAENARALHACPTSLLCPASSSTSPIGYAGCHHGGQSQVAVDNNGTLFLNSSIRFDELVDGLHHTLLLGDAVDVRWAEGTHGSLRNFGAGFGEPWTPIDAGVDANTANSRRAEVREEIRKEALVPTDETHPNSMPEGLTEEDERDDSTIDAMNGEASVIESLPPPPPTAESLPLYRLTGFWPAHRNEGNFLLVDGSVRVFSTGVSQDLLRQLANRLDHQTVEF